MSIIDLNFIELYIFYIYIIIFVHIPIFNSLVMIIILIVDSNCIDVHAQFLNVMKITKATLLSSNLRSSEEVRLCAVAIDG